MQMKNDIHVHTYLSKCGQPSGIPKDYIEKAVRQGFTTIGFADHLWDSDVEGASGWYRSQDMNHLLQIRNLLPEKRDDIKILVGCETEYCGNGKLAITPEHAAMLDFVLVPVTHFHMKDFVRPAWMTQSRDLANLMVERFLEAVKMDIATGIAHPFLPCGFTDRMEEILSYISDGAFEECFGQAKEHHVSIEIHSQFYAHEDTGAYIDWFCRMITCAKKQGCHFHFGSDAHSIEKFERGEHLQQFLDDCALTEADILPLVR